MSSDLCPARAAWRTALALFLLALTVAVAQAQSPDGTLPDRREPMVVDGTNEHDVFGWGQSVHVRGVVRHGVMAFGGDVVVEGVVEGDVATIGGSVIQRDGSRIGGDVIVLGGAYRRGQNGAAERNPASTTVMIAGFEPELRGLMRNPGSLLAPQWSAVYLGQRFLAVLFWFIVSLVLTGVTPGAVGRGMARLRLSNVRVAVVGFAGSLAVTFGVVACVSILPTVVGALVGITALLLLVTAYLFGRVVIQASTGRWLQRRLFPETKRSEAVALLLGTGFWAALLSLPYIWPFVGAGLLVASLGLALTARYRPGWKQS
ncbi:MAG TPA: hypothetical protein VF723_14325 [Pyrinomonadaceae bacterium]|jgi:hypothetical protein